MRCRGWRPPNGCGLPIRSAIIRRFRAQLTLEPENARVVYGKSLDVFAAAVGEPVERVDLVLVDPTSGEEEVLPMFPETSDRWRAVLSRVTLPRQYFVRAGRARSRRFSLDVITTPRIEELRCRVSPPAYTHLGDYEGPLPSGGLSGLPGTQVQVWATSNRPLRGGTVRLLPTVGKAHDVALEVSHAAGAAPRKSRARSQSRPPESSSCKWPTPMARPLKSRSAA